MEVEIRTNKEVFFKNGLGVVTIKLDMPIIRFEGEEYELRLIDSCTKTTVVDGKEVIKKVGVDEIRTKRYSYDYIQAVASSLSINISKDTLVRDIEELFREGLLKLTQQECINGVSGVENKGIYYSEAQDWEIVR